MRYKWCSEVTIKYCTPTFSAQGIVSLLANSGMICGLGDNRQEKGNGSFGSFSVYSAEDMGEGQGLWDEIVAEGREVQELAYEHPECYDDTTQELMDFLMKNVCEEPHKIFIEDIWSGGARLATPVKVRRLVLPSSDVISYVRVGRLSCAK